MPKKGGKLYCEYCQNSNPRFFFIKDELLICRVCIKAKKIIENPIQIKAKNPLYSLSCKLTNPQKKASDFIVENWKNKKSVAIDAVCGAGKSEIIIHVVYLAIKKGEKVGITTPRKDLVLELEEKFKKFIKNIKICTVYGGKTSDLKATLFILTTHQLFRFRSFFDLLVVDEVDAFPFYNNLVLRQYLKKSGKGNLVYLSATMPTSILENKKIKKYEINQRFHGFPLPIPTFKRTFFYFRKINKILKSNNEGVVLVFFPTISMVEQYSKKFKVQHLKIHSKIKNKEETFKKISNLKKGVVLTTNILERGITIPNSHVIVFKANHYIFDSQSLIQICGRVGRKKNHPSGNIYFLDFFKSKKIKGVIKKIERKNNNK